MKTGKFIFPILLGLFIAQIGFAQGPGIGQDTPFSDKKDARTTQVFPNPATDFLTLKLEHPQAKKIKLTVYTIIGNTVEVESEVMDDFEIRLKVRDLPSGYYLLALTNQESNYKNTLKFLKR